METQPSNEILKNVKTIGKKRKVKGKKKWKEKTRELSGNQFGSGIERKNTEVRQEAGDVRMRNVIH